MGYALFAQRKLVLDSQLNSAQLQQTQRSNEQFKLANDSMALKQELGSIQSSQALELADLYQELASASNDQQRQSIQGDIDSLKLQHQAQIDQVNRDIYTLGVKENSIEMEVKSLDTEVTALQKQLEGVEQAEGQGINRATPKFGGVG